MIWICLIYDDGGEMVEKKNGENKDDDYDGGKDDTDVMVSWYG